MQTGNSSTEYSLRNVLKDNKVFMFLWPVMKFAYVVDVLYFIHHVSLYPH